MVNSFSKYFNMTGWRLGWLVVPQAMVSAVEKVAQNLYLCPSTPIQHAALACFAPETPEIYETRRREFHARRDYLVPALRSLGLEVTVVPDGAFYVLVDVSATGMTSDALATLLLHETGVCAVPGRDFGQFEPDRWMRLSYATSMANLQESIERMATVVPALVERHQKITAGSH